MKQELKHLAPYLPYGLRMKMVIGNKSKRKDIEILSTLNYYTLVNLLRRKPILRPLSDLTKEIEVNGEKETYIRHLAEIYFKAQLNANYEHAVNVREVKLMAEKYPELLPFNLIKKLFEWHFDVFGLIEQGLAIDINTLQS